MGTKKLDLYKLGVVLDVDGAKGLNALKATDKELKAVDQDAKKAEGSLGKFAKGVNRVTSVLKGNVAGAGGGSFLPGLANISQIIQGLPQIGQLAHALVSPLTDAAEAGIRFNAFLETTEIGLKKTLFGGSREKARAFIKDMRDFAQASPFRTEPLIKTAQYMAAVGFQVKEIKPVLTDVGDAIAATGEISEEAVQSVVRAMGKMRSEGRVSSEVMEMLTDANVPAWEMLAHAIGKTVAETRKLSELGKLSGPGAVEAIRAEMRARYGGMMDELENSLTGRTSAAQDILQSAQARATEGLTQNISESLGIALKRGDAPARMAAIIDQMLTPVSGLVKASASGLLGGGLTSGLAEGITATKGIALKAISELGFGTIKTLMEIFDMHSPSRVMAEMGENVVEGFENGLVDRTSRGFDRWANALERAGGDAFIKGVEGIAKRLGVDPAWLLNVMAFESGISAKAANKGSSARGLIQFMNPTAKGLGLSGSNAFLGMNAMEQLKYVERYYKPFAGKMRNQGDVYSAVAAGRLGGRSGVLFRAGSREYRANRTWDADRDGIITSQEIGGLAANRGGFRSTGDFSAANPLPVTIMGGVGIDFSAGGGSFNPGAAPKVLEQARRSLTQTIQDTEPVIVNVRESAEELITTNRDIAGVERLHFQALLPLPKATQDTTLAFGHAAKTVITSAQDMSKRVMSALAGLSGALPQQQVGKKRGLFSKILGVAAPFLNFIPGVGPILSTLASIGSSALGGDWGGALMGAAGGFASGGAFRGSSSGSSTPHTTLAPQTVNFTNPALPRRARGGRVFGGRAYLIGEERAEVFTPDEDGWVHPDASRYGGRSGGGGGGGHKGGFWNEGMERLIGAIEKFEAMSPGEVLTRGSKTHPGAIGDGLMRAGTRDPKVVEWMQRRTA
jgi:tape measure domain-containing protein